MNNRTRLILMLLAGTLALGTAAAKNGADDPKGDDRGGQRTSDSSRRGTDDAPGDDRGGANRDQRAALCKTSAVKADPALWAKYECADDKGEHGPGHTRLNTPGQLLTKHGADDPPGDDRGRHGPGHASLKTNGQLLAKHGADDPPGDDHGGHGPGHA